MLKLPLLNIDLIFPSNLMSILIFHHTTAICKAVKYRWMMGSAFFVTVWVGTAYRKIWRLVNNFFCLHNKVDCSEFPTVLSNLLYHYFFHWIMAHFNFVISQNAKWGDAGFYIDRRRMTSLLTCACLISILWLVFWGLQSKIKNMRTGKYSFTKKALMTGIL